MSDGQSPAPKRSKAEGGLSASLSGGASSPAPAREGVDVSPQGGQKAKGKQRYTRSIFDRMFDTTDESSDDKCFGDCGGADHPPLENEFHEDESSDVLGISGSPGPRPTITPAAASAGDEQQRGFSPSKNSVAGMQSSSTPGSPSGKCESDGEGREELSANKEFGDEFATILGTDPPLSQFPTPLAKELFEVCTSKARSVREWLLTSAREEAAPCACPTPLPMWDKADPKKAATCGRQQAYIISTIDMQVCRLLLVAHRYNRRQRE